MNEAEVESYIVEKYCLSRHQARRLMATYGSDKSELDALLGASGRTLEHREEDVGQTSMQVSF